MKKNVMMRVASIMLVLVLMSSSVISGTFAKYVTSGESKDNARVAKFGVTVTGDSTMFEQEYYGVETGWEGALTVKSSNGDKLVAPGTSGTLAEVALAGKPEVAVRISNEAEFSVGNLWGVDTTDNNVNDGFVSNLFYCPIVVTVIDAAATEHKICGLDFDTAADFEAEVEKAINTATVEYEPNTDLTAVHDIYVAWEWAFEGSTEGGTGHAEQLDKYDTQLGDRAAADAAATISLKITTYVTQID